MRQKLLQSLLCITALFTGWAVQTTHAQKKEVTFKAKLEPAHGRYFRGAPAVGSPLSAIHVNVGDRVSKGQKLLSLVEAASDEEKYRHAHDAAIAAAESLKIQTENMGRIVKRSTDLARVHANAKEEHERAELTLKRLHADLRGAEARILQSSEEWRVAKVMRGYYAITAPFDGVVISLSARLGSVESYPDSKTTWIEVIDPSVLEVRCHVADEIADQLKTGKSVSVLHGDSRWQAKIVDIGIAADVESGKIPVRIEVPQKKEGRQLRCWTSVIVDLNP